LQLLRTRSTRWNFGGVRFHSAAHRTLLDELSELALKGTHFRGLKAIPGSNTVRIPEGLVKSHLA
jgi:hypothetical protein